MSDTRATKYGLLGCNLGHSFSPCVHSELGLQEYEIFDVAEDDFEAFMNRSNIAGFNVTIPYKKRAFERCNWVSPEAQAMGSVNVAVRAQEGTLRGYNTDYQGFMNMLAVSDVEVANKKVLVLGTGGASQAVQFALGKMEPREVRVISRSGDDNYNNLERHFDAEVVINATPVGMYPRDLVSPVDLTQFSKLEAAVDLIYNPLRTAFLQQAENMGVLAVNGLYMLVDQARLTEEIFFDKHITASESKRITNMLTRELSNIVLIGMPGCGKSRISRELAKRMNKQPLDIDREIEIYARRTSAELIEEEGVPMFRKVEEIVTGETCSKTGKIIATGGGVVEREANKTRLRQNARVYYVQRDLDALATHGRPLSRDGAALQEMFDRRDSLYRDFADAIVDNNGEAAATAAEIERDFNENLGA
jgi:shikimate dehydrogenase